jgi:hypothetical protein
MVRRLTGDNNTNKQITRDGLAESISQAQSEEKTEERIYVIPVPSKNGEGRKRNEDCIRMDVDGWKKCFPSVSV